MPMDKNRIAMPPPCRVPFADVRRRDTTGLSADPMRV